jgi:hypothetical protein
MTRIGRTKAIATVLATIADAFPETVPPRESEELLWDTNATHEVTEHRCQF